MANSLSVGGLASGLDTNSIIDGLTQIEQNRVSRIDNQKKVQEAKLNAFKELENKLKAFADKASSLSEAKSFNEFISTTSDEEAITLDGNSDAIPGTYNVEIESLAANLKVASKTFNSTTTALGFAGSFEVNMSKAAIKNDPVVTTKEITITAGDTLKTVVSKINATEGLGVKASIVSLAANDYRLVLTAVDEGTAGFFAQDTGGSNILDAGGFDILNYDQKVVSDFSLKKAHIGAADGSTKITELFAGIGAGSTITATDEFAISGTDSAGNAVSGTFNITGASTVDDLLAQVKSVFESVRGPVAGEVNVSLNTSGEIVITDKNGGLQELDFSMSLNDVDASGSSIALSGVGETGRVQNNFLNTLRDGKKAFYNIDGLSVASDSNKDEKSMTGTIFELKKAELGVVHEVTLERDVEGIKKKITDFINGYNDVIKYLDAKSKVTIEGSDDPNGKQTVGTKGPFSGDSSIMRIKTQMQSLLTSNISELTGISSYTSVSAIGITTDTKSGELKLDSDKFEDAVAQDFEGVRNLFITSGYSDNTSHKLGRYTDDTVAGKYSVSADTDEIDTDSTAGIAYSNVTRTGIVLTSSSGNSKGLSVEAANGSGVGNFTFVRGAAGKISHYWKQISNGLDGFISTTKKTINKSIDQYSNDAEKQQRKVDSFRDKMVKRFADLEQSMARLQSQSSSFQSQMASLR